MPEEFERPGRAIDTGTDMQGGSTDPREKARSAGRDLLDRAVDKKDELKQRANSMADERRTGIADRASSLSRALHGAADTLRDNGEPQLSDWVHEAAGQVERVVGYLEGKRADGMADDLENMARGNPALFLGGTYVAGLALGRFLRATSPDRRSERDSERAGDGSFRGEDAERLERGGADVVAVHGDLGSTGWSGVGVAPGAFEASEAEDRTSPEPSRRAPGASGAGSETMHGAGSGSDADVFGLRSDAEPSDPQRDFRAGSTSGHGRSGLGASGMGTPPSGAVRGSGEMRQSGHGSMNVGASDRGLGGGAAGRADAPGGPAEGERSTSFSDPHVVQTDRDLHEAAPRRDVGGTGGSGRKESMDRSDRSRDLARDTDRERDSDREV